MEIKIIVVGKTNSNYLKEGEQNYDDRIRHYLSHSEVIIPELKNARNLSSEQIKNREGELILKQVLKSHYVVLLDENGQNLTSIEMSNWIQKRMNAGQKCIVFVVGGAYGFSKDVYTRSDYKLSLSKMTFSHQMVRLFFREQLYRAFTILKGEPYHHN